MVRAKKKSTRYDASDDEASVGTATSLPIFTRKTPSRSQHLAHFQVSAVSDAESFITNSSCHPHSPYESASSSVVSSSVVNSGSSANTLEEPKQPVKNHNIHSSGCNHVSCHVSLGEAMKSVAAALGGILGSKMQDAVVVPGKKEERTTSETVDNDARNTQTEKRDGADIPVKTARTRSTLFPPTKNRCILDAELSVDLENEVPDMERRPGSRAMSPLRSCRKTHTTKEKDEILVKNLKRSKFLRSQKKMGGKNKFVDQVRTGVIGIDSFGKPMPLSIIKVKDIPNKLDLIEETNE